jgi:hypothetical protein
MKTIPLPSLDYLNERLICDPDWGLYWKPKKVTCPQDATWNARYAGKLAGSKFKNGYHYLTLDDGPKYMVHRIMWKMVTGQEPCELIDHRDLNPSNNRFKNLREASSTNNQCNRHKTRANTSGYKGVYKHGPGWRVQIKHSGKLHQVGTFPTKEQAHEAYTKAADRLHGQFALS